MWEVALVPAEAVTPADVPAALAVAPKRTEAQLELVEVPLALATAPEQVEAPLAPPVSENEYGPNRRGVPRARGLPGAKERLAEA